MFPHNTVIPCAQESVLIIGKEQIGDKRFTHPLFLAVILLLSIMHGKVSVVDFWLTGSALLTEYFAQLLVAKSANPAFA